MLYEIQRRTTGATQGRQKWYRNPKLLRHSVMVFFFVFLLHVAYDHQVKGGGPRGAPSVEAYCPFGGLESLYQFITTGGFVRRIEPSAMIIFGALVLLTLFASRGFCGWICPFGSLQEWLGLLGRRIFKKKKKFNPTGSWDRALRNLKYVVLVVVIALTWWTGSLVFRNYDPFLAFFHLGFGINELPWAYAILAAVLIGSLFIDRFFCKYACPLGAALGLLGKLGLTRIRRNIAACKECNVCQKKSWAHVDFLRDTEVRDLDCNHCLDCVLHCPKPNVLSVRGPRVRFSHPAYAAVLLAGLFGLIGTSRLAGKWQTKPEAVSLRNADGKLDAENIRGWMSLAEISAGYGVPLDHLYKACGLPSSVPPTARLNTIAREHHLEFEPDSVRDAVRRFLAGEAISGKRPATKKAAEHKPKTGERKGGHTEEPEVRGFMTLNEIALKTGVPKDYFVRTLNLPADIDPRKPVREWIHEHGKTIQDLRDAVKQYQARK